MITEDYVSFEVAKLLKDKGFNGTEIHKYYDVSDKKPILYSESYIHEFDKDFWMEDLIMAPTLQMAMKWLREVHNLCLFIIPATIDKTFRTGYALYPRCDSKWEWCASKNDRSEATFGFNVNRKYCDSYEQAVEVAIKYCLENLI